MLLALALLLGQLVLVAHAADHALHPDQPVCQLCVHAHVGAAPQPAANVHFPALAVEPPFLPLQPPSYSVAACAYGARAPPR